jgi:hypothetical protein
MSTDANITGTYMTKKRAICFVILLALTSATLFNVIGVLRSRNAIRDETGGVANSKAVRDEEGATRRVHVPPQARSCVNDEKIIDGSKMVAYEGVNFAYPVLLASEIKSEIKPVFPLTGETDKPEGVVPAHVSFTLVGPYASRHTSSYFAPELSIYPIPKYKDALALSRNYVESLEKDIQSLKMMLAEQPTSPEKEIPFLPFGIDATQAFHSRVKYINFKNGRGIMFLTQFNIEPSLVNNQGLVYTFQGLTDDGLNYVSARFPVTVPFLPPSYEPGTFDNYTLPTYFYGKDKVSNEEKYKIYLSKITRRLDELPSDKFEPRLTLLESLILSLCVETK